MVLNFNYLNTISDFLPVSCEVCKKMKPASFTFYWPCDITLGYSHWKWYEMVAMVHIGIKGMKEFGLKKNVQW